MKILLTAILVAILTTLPTATATSSILPNPEPQLLERLDFQKELEVELSILKKIKLTKEQKEKLIKLDLELEQKRPPAQASGPFFVFGAIPLCRRSYLPISAGCSI